MPWIICADRPISPGSGGGTGKPDAGQGKPGAAGIAQRTEPSGTSGFTETSRGVSGDPGQPGFCYNGGRMFVMRVPLLSLKKALSG